MRRPEIREKIKDRLKRDVVAGIFLVFLLLMALGAVDVVIAGSNTNLEQQITAGTFTVTMNNAQIDYPSQTAGTTTNSTAKLENTMRIKDFRGNTAGWSVSANASPFNHQSNSSSISANELNWDLTNETCTGLNGASCTGTGPGDGNKSPLGNSQNIYFANSSSGAGEFQINNTTMNLHIDVGDPTGTYISTLAVSIS